MDEEVGVVDNGRSNGTTDDHQPSIASIFQKANHPVTLKFEDVAYKIKIPKNGSRIWDLHKNGAGRAHQRTILNGITGIVKPGEVLAMLGPSGSGKTTLLTALAGRLARDVTGIITYNHMPLSSSMKRSIGFVAQDDVLYPHLTVSETLIFTALLRLPKSMTKSEKIQQAEAVISQLGLTECKSSIIGGPLMRGVSGGERKRVSIGQEMLINPSLLFLDEPTSGLDSTKAQRIVSTLCELARGGRTVVMTIHQPSSRIFYMFHKLLLLSEGNPLYFGDGSAAMDYFAGVGYAPSIAMNPADFLLDVANGVIAEESKEEQTAVKQKVMEAYKSYLDERIRAEIREFDQAPPQDFADEKKNTNAWSTTWWQQFRVLLTRGLKERQHESFSGLKVGQVITVAVLSGLLWWQSCLSNLQDQIGLLFFISGFWGFFPLFQAIFTFPQERMVLQKERSSGTYRLSSYFMARTTGDLPMELALPTLFLLITYFMAGLNPHAAHFFQTLLVLLFSVLVSQGLGLALGALVMDQKSATTLGSVIMLTFLLAGGYYVQNVPPFIMWIKYLSVSQYTYKLMILSQYKASDTYPCGEDNVRIFCP